MSTLAQDLRYALRSVRRRPLLTTVSVAVLALAIGANTAVFSVVDAVLLRPLPFAEPSRLVIAWQYSPARGVPLIEVSYPDYQDWAAQSRTLGPADQRAGAPRVAVVSYGLWQRSSVATRAWWGGRSSSTTRR